MYEEEWNRFMRTGQVSDYLAYREHFHTPNATGKSGEINECRYAGFHNPYGDCNKIGANR